MDFRYRYDNIMLDFGGGIKMNDIKILEMCTYCGSLLTLMESIRTEDGTLWLVKRCLRCASHPVEEVARLYQEDKNDVKS